MIRKNKGVRLRVRKYIRLSIIFLLWVTQQLFFSFNYENPKNSPDILYTLYFKFKYNQSFLI